MAAHTWTFTLPRSLDDSLSWRTRHNLLYCSHNPIVSDQGREYPLPTFFQHQCTATKPDMKARILVNRQIVQRNRKDGTDLPCISVRTYRGTQRVHEVKFTGPAVLVSTNVPQPNAYGTTVWIEAEYDTLELISREYDP